MEELLSEIELLWAHVEKETLQSFNVSLTLAAATKQAKYFNGWTVVQWVQWKNKLFQATGVANYNEFACSSSTIVPVCICYTS